jgi:hypothetical protein
MIALMATAFVMIMLFVLISSYRSQPLDDPRLTHEVYLDKIYFSPHILNVVDPDSKEVLSGTIDLARFTTRALSDNNQYLNQEKSSIGVQLTLYDDQHRILTVPGGANPIYQNEQTYKSLIAFAQQGVRGAGGATMQDQMIPVNYYEGDVPKRGYLEVITVRANS